MDEASFKLVLYMGHCPKNWSAMWQEWHPPKKQNKTKNNNTTPPPKKKKKNQHNRKQKTNQLTYIRAEHKLHSVSESFISQVKIPQVMFKKKKIFLACL